MTPIGSIPVASSEVTQELPVRTERQRQARPLESYSCWRSLRTGICWVVFFLGYLIAVLKFSIGALQEKHDRFCTGASAGAYRSVNCPNLKHAIENAQHISEMIDHEPITMAVLGVLCILTCAVGSWAIFGKSANPAKLFLWSWPMKVVLGTVLRVVQHRLMNEYGVDHPPFETLSWCVDIFFLFCFLRMCWSFRVTFEKRNKAASSNADRANAQLSPSSNIV